MKNEIEIETKYNVLEKEVIFEDKALCNISAFNLKQTPFVLHNDVLEIVLVIKGTVFIHVSCENFYLYPGDYIAINDGDPYFIQDARDDILDEIAQSTSVPKSEEIIKYKKNNEDPIILSFQIDLKKLLKVNSYIKNMFFTLESFDLPRYKHQENLIRNKLIDLANLFILKQSKNINNSVINLIKLFFNEYTMNNYYNRNTYFSEEKIAKFFGINADIYEYFYKRNALEFIAEKENYSKSYISHLFKEIGSISFSDSLNFYRVAEAEKMLLSTDLSLFDIAYKCGFSDTKYLINNFKEWFHMTPGQYRKNLRPYIKQEEIIKKIDVKKLKTEFIKLKKMDTENEKLRFSINPMTLKRG